MPAGTVERLAPLLKAAHSKAEYQRVQCVWLCATLVLTSQQIAEALGWQASSVRHVQARYFREGADSLRDQPHGGWPHAHLTREEEKQLLAPFLARAEQGEVVIAAPVQQAHTERLGHPVHHSVVYRALHRQGWRKVQPRPQHPKTEVGVQEEFKKKLPQVIQELIQQDVENRPVRLMLEDEARFGRLSEPHRCWAPQGVRPTVRTQIVREYEYVYAVVSPHDGVLDTLVLPEVNTEAMGLFLAEVSSRHTAELIVVVLDGAGWHKAKHLPIPTNMLLVSLPPWSPQLNPAEHVWDEVREKHFANRWFETMDQLDEQLVTALASLEADARRTASLTGFDWITCV